MFGMNSAIELKKKKIDSELIHNKTFLKTKIKSYSDEATNFQDK